MTGIYQPITSPISPLDPFISAFPSPPPRQSQPAITISRATSTASTMTTNTTRQFLSAVYLDSPSLGRGIADSERVLGSTKPLRVRKKLVNGARIAPIAGSHRRRHRSTLSLPRSPTSPRMPLIPSKPSLQRTDTTSTNPSAHRAISHLFLSTPLSPSPLPPPRRVLVRGKHRSSLHLGLGVRDTSLSPIGFSPTLPPSPSPRLFYSTGHRAGYRTKPLPLPPSPLTPTRAPSKAAKLLGTDVPLPARKNEKKALTGKHFRPLPGSTKADIDLFFGNVPRATSSNRKPVPGAGDIHAAGGRGMEHRDETGRIWLDAEEEQEFAWLLSNAPSISPPINPPEMVRDSSSSEEDKWSEDAFDLERFTSVLSLAPPKARSSGNSKKADKILGITRGKVEDSWLDLGMDAPLPTIKRGVQPKTPKRTISDELFHPWSNRSLGASLGGSVPTSTARAVTEPIRPKAKRADSGDRKRPPPLTLAPAAPRRDLPVLTPTTPTGPGKLSVVSPLRVAPIIKIPQLPRLQTPPAIPLARRIPSEPRHVPPPGVKAPTTPFLHPRKAPSPARAPLVPPLPLANVPVVKKKPSLAAMTNPDLPILGESKPRVSTESAWTDEETQVSWFEPVTPVEEHGEGFRLISGSGSGRKVSAGPGWLGKMRKTSSGRV